MLTPGDGGVATSGDYVRGRHIYDPHRGRPAGDELASLTVVGPDIYEADRFATAAFAMGQGGVEFIEDAFGLEAYAIGRDGVATMTSGFNRIGDQRFHSGTTSSGSSKSIRWPSAGRMAP